MISLYGRDCAWMIVEFGEDATTTAMDRPTPSNDKRDCASGFAYFLEELCMCRASVGFPAMSDAFL